LGSGAIAPTQFTGDLSGFENGTLSVDLATFAGRGGTFPKFGTVRITGAGDSALFDLASTAPPVGTWQTFSSPLNAAAWGKTAVEWTAILLDVREIAISRDAFDGADTIGIDNFIMASEQQPVPEPISMLLFGTGLVGIGGYVRRKLKS
jgi:hypothetical protein